MAKSEHMEQSLVKATGKKKGGRPLGRKNDKTLKREALREAAIDVLSAKVGKVVEVVVEQALDGCTKSQKLILDRVLPAVKSVDSKEGDAPKPISIVFGTYTGGASRPFVETVDGDFKYED